MCFIGKNVTKLTASESITCYKVVNGKTRRRRFRFWKYILISATSDVFEYKYVPWKDNPTVELEAMCYQDTWNNTITQVEAGYHSYIDPIEERNLYTVKCIIPAGSTYYVNKKEYVSSNLIMTDEII